MPAIPTPSQLAENTLINHYKKMSTPISQLSPEEQIIYQDATSVIKASDCFPCPLTGTPCPTNGAMGTIPYYYYPGDCPNSKPCEDEAKYKDPCPCGQTYANNCDGSCPQMTFDLY